MTALMRKINRTKDPERLSILAGIDYFVTRKHLTARKRKVVHRFTPYDAARLSASFSCDEQHPNG